MNKYRVLKPYPKQITNSGRLVTLQKGRDIYLKREAQVLRLIKLGFIKPVIELPKKTKKAVKIKESKPKTESTSSLEVEDSSTKDKESKEQSKRKNKSDYLNKK